MTTTNSSMSPFVCALVASQEAAARPTNSQKRTQLLANQFAVTSARLSLEAAGTYSLVAIHRQLNLMGLTIDVTNNALEFLVKEL
jgi:hypothetical protein